VAVSSASPLAGFELEGRQKGMKRPRRNIDGDLTMRHDLLPGEGDAVTAGAQSCPYGRSRTERKDSEPPLLQRVWLADTTGRGSTELLTGLVFAASDVPTLPRSRWPPAPEVQGESKYARNQGSEAKIKIYWCSGLDDWNQRGGARRGEANRGEARGGEGGRRGLGLPKGDRTKTVFKDSIVPSSEAADPAELQAGTV